MTVCVSTAPTCCATLMPRARKAASTVSLWTRSPKIVSGCARDWFRARLMASRTPKHMPRCSALIIFIHFVSQSKRPYPFQFVQNSFYLFRLGLLDDFFQQIDVTGEGLLAGRGQGARR